MKVGKLAKLSNNYKIKNKEMRVLIMTKEKVEKMVNEILASGKNPHGYLRELAIEYGIIPKKK